jgi:hypothetical protein
MRCSRTTAAKTVPKTFLLVATAFAAAGALVPAGGAHDGTSRGTVPRLAFPLVAKTVLWDNYGDPRGNGSHAGIDMENPWRAPVVAVEPGRVEYSTSNLGGCMLYLYGRSGTMYMYIHLNNDLGPRNDNKGRCVEGTAYAVPDGASVLTGQQIAFNGDSGDANGNHHLHFEVHPKGGADVNPFPHLKKAQKLLFAAREGAEFSLALRGRLIAAGTGSLRVSATNVRFYPGGKWLEIDARPVEVGVPPDPAVQDEVAGVVSSQRLASVKPPARVAVYTAKARVTKDALVGAPRALVASRVASLSR